MGTALCQCGRRTSEILFSQKRKSTLDSEFLDGLSRMLIFR